MHGVDSAVRDQGGRLIPVPGVYRIDPVHTQVAFVARHLMITRVRGRFNDVSGVIIVEDDPERSSVMVEIDVTSVDTGNTDRDAHLRSADFLLAEAYPAMSFRSTAVAPGDADTWTVTGDLTLRGVTRPIDLRVEFDGASASPTGEQRISFHATADIDRDAWGLTWNQALETGGLVVGRQIHIELEVQAVAVASDGDDV